MNNFGNLSLAAKVRASRETHQSSFLELQGKFEEKIRRKIISATYVSFFLRRNKRITLTCRFVNCQHGFIPTGENACTATTNLCTEVYRPMFSFSPANSV